MLGFSLQNSGLVVFDRHCLLPFFSGDIYLLCISNVYTLAVVLVYSGG